MNAFIEFLNRWAEHFPAFAWAMLWQSSLLIGVLFIVEMTFQRKLRPSVRYALWMVLLLKLVLPPGLASPTNPRWWVHEPAQPMLKISAPAYTVTYGDPSPAVFPMSAPAPLPPPPPALSRPAWTLIASFAISCGLLGWLGFRWTGVIRKVRAAKTLQELETTADADVLSILPRNVRLRLTSDAMSPAVCGLFRPVILLPRSLADNLSPAQLKAVLLHELIHIRRGDVWINCAQALLQIVYWWHPLLWLANARIRRVREEAVDDAVMLALREEAEVYAPTLLEVAKFAFRRPLASLGLVGILESRSALRQRIERLMEFRAPKRAGLTVASLVGILAFTAVAVPMGEGPAPANDQLPADMGLKTVKLKVDPAVFIRNIKAQEPWVMASTTNDYGEILLTLLDIEGVNCSPTLNGHGFAFNRVTGEITKEGTPEELEIFQKVIEQLNRTDEKPELPLHATPYHRKSVFVDTRFYKMQNEDFEKMVAGLRSYGSGNAMWWSIPPNQFADFTNQVRSLGLKAYQRPRIQTGHGMRAEFYVGNPTNNLELDCQPFIRKSDGIDGAVDLLLQAKTVGQFTDDPAGDWPVTEGTNRYAIKNMVSALDHGGVVVRAINPAGGPSNNLVILLNLAIATNDAIHGSQRTVPVIRPASGTNNTAMTVTGILTDPNFRKTLHTLEQRGGVETLAEPEIVTTSGRQVNYMSPNVVARAMARTNSTGTVGATAVETTDRTAVTSTETFKIEKPVSQEQLDELLRAAGVRTPPTAIIYRDRLGLLFAQGTRDQLALVYKVVLRQNGLTPTEKQIEDFAKEATPPSDGKELTTRVFKVDKNASAFGLYAMSGTPDKDVAISARDFYSKIGIDLTTAGRSIAYNDRVGLLFVKASTAELDTIERTIQAFNIMIPPQVHMKARFIEVPKKGFVLPATFTNVATGPMTGILDDANFRTILRSLHRPDVETLAEPEVVTTSGRQTQMRATDLQNILTNFALVETGTNDSIVAEVGKFEIGPTIDLVPNVLADGYTINLTAIPLLLEFLGYDKPTNDIPTVDKSGRKLQLPQVLPRFRIAETTATVNLWDNQTLVLGNLHHVFVDSHGEVATETKDFADKEKKSGRLDKELLVFVTVTLVDAAGNRLHSDDELPFNPSSIPSQPQPVALSDSPLRIRK